MFAQPLRSSSPDLYHGKYAASLFASGEQGAWYDPSDLTTMFQDAAGTTPVTGVEQPVGRILDKSGRGNRATQTTTASRPTLSSRVNLLTNTEALESASWSKVQSSVSVNSAVAPNGTLTADTFIPNSGIAFTSAVGVFVNSQSSFNQSLSVAATAYKYRLSVKDAGYDMVQLRVSEANTLAGTNIAVTRVSLINGAVLTQSGTGNLTGVTGTCTRTGDGWCDITLTFTSGAAQTLFFGLWAWNTTAVTSDGVKGLHIWGADLRVANESPTLPPYQRVNTATDYDTQGFPLYLRFDGVDDWLVTPPINFTSTDKMTVFAGSRYFGDAGAILCELSVNASSSNGTFGCYVNDNSAGREAVAGRVSAAASTFITAPKDITRVTTRQIDFAQPTPETELAMRVNGVTQTPVFKTPASAGTGNFGNYPLFIGRRSGTQFPFNGRLYGLIVRGAETDNLHLTNVERFLAHKSGVVL